jgi:hypothetical protein
MADKTLIEIMKMSPAERRATYQVGGKYEEGVTPAKHIDQVTIDGNVFKDYSAFSFIMEKTFLKSPVRSNSGSINNLDSYASFLTPHLQINFGLMSIDSYRTMMKLIQSKNEFTVTCYDIVNDIDVTHNMYFATEQMPKLFTIASSLSGSNSYVELLGVQDYTIELIGTNTGVTMLDITYKLNVPSDATWGGDKEVTRQLPMNLTQDVGAVFTVENNNYDATEITFDNKYKFLKWTETQDGSGFAYIDRNEYRFTTNKTLYAQWSAR